MSIKDVYTNLFERIRRIRQEEFPIIEKALDGRRFKHALEIGCGDGTQSLMLMRICDELVSTDIDSRDIPPERLAKLNFKAVDASDLPFPDKHFDLIFSSNVLEHIDSIDNAVDEMSRVLKDDGIIIHVLPNATWKYLQLILWIPFRFKVLFAWIAGRKQDAEAPVREFGSQKDGKQTKSSKWFPPIHGVAKSHFEEIKLFRVSRWKNLFERRNLKIEKSFGLLLYSAWNVGPAWLRLVLQSMGIKSSHCFFLSKSQTD